MKIPIKLSANYTYPQTESNVAICNYEIGVAIRFQSEVELQGTYTTYYVSALYASSNVYSPTKW